jgi:diadenylate cyclase
LVKGIAVILAFAGIAVLLNLNTILWILKNTISVGIVAVIVLFQPELRRALEELGRKNIFTDVLIRDDDEKDERLNDNTIRELVSASIAMSKNKTGALMVLEQDVALGEYEGTGINIDACVTSQLLVNIFEKNTPLHDGAVIIRNNRIVSATCYLPLTDRSDINKELGTRHRAALGLSEVSDSMILIVSEETGAISVARGGVLSRNLDSESLRKQLDGLRDKKKPQTRRIAKRTAKKTAKETSKKRRSKA